MLVFRDDAELDWDGLDVADGRNAGKRTRLSSEP